MNVAFCVEDDSDEECLRLFAAAILSEEVTPLSTTYKFRRGGWTQALKLAPSVVRYATQSGADGVIMCIDNDGQEPAHVPEHDESPDKDCRACRLKASANLGSLRWHGVQIPVVIFAVPVQTIETWLALLKGHPFSGPPEALGRNETSRRDLKQIAYGMERPAHDDRVRTCRELVKESRIVALETASSSFRQFADQVRALGRRERPSAV